MSKFKELIKAYKEDRIGDVAVLKLDLFGFKLHPIAEKALEGKTFSVEDDDLIALAKLPKGSLGRAYADHMNNYGLKPFTISEEYRHLAKKQMKGIRYIKTHDVIHVLTGFDTSLEGEIGVLYFTYAQKMYRFQGIAAIVAMMIYPILKPLRFPAIVRAAKKGFKIGKQAKHLLAVPYEEIWEQSIDQVRSDLRINLN